MEQFPTPHPDATSLKPASPAALPDATPAPALDPCPASPATCHAPPDTAPCNVHPSTDFPPSTTNPPPSTDSAASPGDKGPSSNGPAFTPALGESARAFAAFCAYLELGPRRRYSAVARKAGVSVRTIERWATQFDWRERLTTHAAQATTQFVQQQASALADTAAREKDLRERQLILAGAILNLTERYFERLDDMDLEHVRLPDVCRALEFASRVLAPDRPAEPAAAPDTGLRDQLATLLDQAFRDTPKPASP